MGNPVNSFLMIKLLTKDMQMFFDLFNSAEESKSSIIWFIFRSKMKKPAKIIVLFLKKC